MVGHPLVELAQAALGRVAAAPPATELARSGLADLAERSTRRLAVGLRGDAVARTRVIDRACGELLLDLSAPAGDRGAVVRLRRGAVAGARVVRDDGTSELHTPPADRSADRERAEARAAAARGELHTRELAITRIENTVPRVARTRPAWWALWMWPVYWVTRWLARAALAEERAVSRALEAAQVELAAGEREATAIEADAALARTRYRELLRTCRGDAGVAAIELVVTAGPLPDDVDVIVAGEAAVDALVDADAVDLARVRTIAEQGRAVTIARRAGDVLLAARAAIGGALEQVEAICRERRARVEEQRIGDPDAMADLQLARIDGEIVTCVSAVLEHASVHLGSELAQLQAQWIGAIAATTTSDELKAAITMIDQGWDPAAQRVAEEVRVLVAGGLGGSARDLYPGLVAPLLARGLPPEHAQPLRAAPVLPPFSVVPSLATAKSKLDAPSWLSGLVRSFENRRTSVREKVHERIEHLREVSSAELLDAEPRLRAAIAAALRVPLGNALVQQHIAFESALVAAEQANTRDREEAAPLAQISHAAGEDLERLSEQIARA